MFCSNCGKKLKEDERFCKECGMENKGFREEKSSLIKDASTGKTEAIEAIYKMTYRQGFSVAFRMVKNEQDALDILQDAYFSLLHNLKDLSSQDKLKSWFNCIVANKCKDFLKKKKPQLFAEVSSEEETDFVDTLIEEKREFSPEAYADYSETKRLMNEILNRLPEEQKLCILMYYYDELSIGEIAEALECTSGTVKSRLLYARNKIKKDVIELESKGTKLYSVPPIPFMIWMLKSEERHIRMPEGFMDKIVHSKSDIISEVGKENSGMQEKKIAGSVAKKAISKKIIACIVGASVIGGGAVVAINQMHQGAKNEITQKKPGTQKEVAKPENIEEDKTEKPALISETQRQDIQFASRLFDRQQMTNSDVEWGGNEEYTLDLTENKVPLEALRDVIGGIICFDDYSPISGVSPNGTLFKTIKKEECQQILKDTFDYTANTDEIDEVFREVADDQYDKNLISYTESGDSEIRYETRRVVQDENDKYHFYTEVMQRNQSINMFCEIGTMDITAHKNEASKTGGFTFEKIEYKKSTYPRGFNCEVENALESMVKAVLSSGTPQNDGYNPEGTYELNKLTNEEFMEYADYFIEKTYVLNDTELTKPESELDTSGYKVAETAYQDICQGTLGRKKYSYTSNETITDGQVMFDILHDGKGEISVYDFYMVQEKDGTITIYGTLTDGTRESNLYPFTATAKVDADSRLGMVIDKIVVNDDIANGNSECFTEIQIERLKSYLGIPCDSDSPVQFKYEMTCYNPYSMVYNTQKIQFVVGDTIVAEANVNIDDVRVMDNVLAYKENGIYSDDDDDYE